MAPLASIGREALRCAFLEAMSFTASTVNVVTTDGPAGRDGVTVSAMASVSADAPQPALLICLYDAGRAAPVVLENRTFCVNVLGEGQSAVSDLFAGRSALSGADRFAEIAWIPGLTGAPRIAGALAAFDCRLTEAKLVGTHQVIFGAVQDVVFAGSGSQLVYSRRGYRRAAALYG